jgi:2-Cys peroxiredoxin 5
LLLTNFKLFENAPSNAVQLAEVLKGKRVILFGVPGAFTPGCSKTHLPGYITDYQKYREKNVDEIICVSGAYLLEVINKV